MCHMLHVLFEVLLTLGCRRALLCNLTVCRSLWRPCLMISDENLLLIFLTVELLESSSCNAGKPLNTQECCSLSMRGH